MKPAKKLLVSRNGRVYASIFALRRAKGLSQKEFAEKIGVHQTAVSMWEKGTTRPRIAKLRKIAIALDVDVPAIIHAFTD